MAHGRRRSWPPSERGGRWPTAGCTTGLSGGGTAEALAGFVVGYAFSLLFTGVTAMMVIDARSRVPFLSRAIAPNISAVQLAVPISLMAFVGWTLPGGVLWATAAFLAPVYYGWRRLSWPVLLTAASFAGMFGWGMPHLAELG